MTVDGRDARRSVRVETRFLFAIEGIDAELVRRKGDISATGVYIEVDEGIGEIGAAIRRTGHPALFLVDTISSLGSIDYRHDEWGVDVTVGCSQKGLMLPPGLGFNAISEKARAASTTGSLR